VLIDEKGARCGRAALLHSLLHINDGAFCDSFVNGLLPWSKLTPADISLNLKLCGPCVQCLEEKYCAKTMLHADNPPAIAVDMCIVSLC
jgi:hypothetical protein